MKNVVTLISILAAERNYIREHILSTKVQLGRRIFAHILFAHAESLASYLITRVDILNEEMGDHASLAVEDWLAAADEEFTYDNDGFVVERERRSRSLPRVLFALRFAAKFGAITFDPKASKNWPHVKQAYSVRNRITHPKMPSSLEISDADMIELEGMETWLSECLYAVVSK